MDRFPVTDKGQMSEMVFRLKMYELEMRGKNKERERERKGGKRKKGLLSWKNLG